MNYFRSILVESPHRHTVAAVAKDVGNGAPRSAKVAQAQGMVSVQVPCTLDEALVLMRTRGRTSNQSVEDVAAAIIDGQIRFDEDA